MSKRKKKEVAQDIALHVMSNSPNESLYTALQILYREAYLNNIGIMTAKNKKTRELELLLVKLVPNGERFDAYPMAKMLTPVEAENYYAPDGKGGWIKEEPVSE